MNIFILLYYFFIYGLPFIVFFVIVRKTNNVALSILALLTSYFLILTIGRLIRKLFGSNPVFPNCKDCDSSEIEVHGVSNDRQFLTYSCKNCKKIYVLCNGRFMIIEENNNIPYKKRMGFFKKVWTDDNE